MDSLLDGYQCSRHPVRTVCVPCSSPQTPSGPHVRACSTPSSTDSTATMYNLNGSHACVPLSSWAFPLSSPGWCLGPAFPVVVPMCHVRLVLRAWSAMTNSLCSLACPPPPSRSRAHAAATLLAEIYVDEEEANLC
jgi:hypothetical protein